MSLTQINHPVWTIWQKHTACSVGSFIHMIQVFARIRMTVKDYNFRNNWNRTSRDITQHKIIYLSWYVHNLSICSQHEKEKIDMWLLEGLCLNASSKDCLQGYYLPFFLYSILTNIQLWNFNPISFQVTQSCLASLNLMISFKSFESDGKSAHTNSISPL